MDCWTLLELPDDADERSIKRSYAKRLKTTRPDEDAEGFQLLREAYERALQLARWREEEQERPTSRTTLASTLPTMTPANDANLRHWSQLLEIQPAVQALPITRQTDDPAQPLLLNLSRHTLPQRWQQALDLDCAPAFEAGLLRLCFEQPGLRTAITTWAVQHLQWLTPWQQVHMTPWEEEALTSGLLQQYRQTLQELLETRQEPEFLHSLETYSKQPWMQVFDRRQEWQRIVMQLLYDTQWSLPLLDRVCQLLGWDDACGVHPEPAWIWHSLIQRCEQEAFFHALQAKAQDHKTWAPEVQAAQLLLNPLSRRQQQNLILDFGVDHWVACQDLAQTLSGRYPQLIERLPCSDVFFWRKFMPRPPAAQTWIRVWAALALALTLFFLNQEDHSAMPALLFGGTIALIPTAVARLIMLLLWVPTSHQMIALDLWLSERLLPRRLNPHGEWLVLRHAVPQLAMLAVFAALLGPLGMAGYSGFILIGLLHDKRIGHLDPGFSERHPYLTALHWSHWSPLQVIFLLLMSGIILACRIHYPAYPLTRLLPG